MRRADARHLRKRRLPLPVRLRDNLTRFTHFVLLRFCNSQFCRLNTGRFPLYFPNAASGPLDPGWQARGHARGGILVMRQMPRERRCGSKLSTHDHGEKRRSDMTHARGLITCSGWPSCTYSKGPSCRTNPSGRFCSPARSSARCCPSPPSLRPAPRRSQLPQPRMLPIY